MTRQIDGELLMGNDDCGRREQSSADGPYYAGSSGDGIMPPAPVRVSYHPNFDVIETDGRLRPLI